ncbi:MAG: hypothetical protein SFU99_08460 [Saprospiraceae bacterium]|nr:hypothetical protein [Saprospiraceae bacterium]
MSVAYDEFSATEGSTHRLRRSVAEALAQATSLRRSKEVRGVNIGV